MSTTTKNPETSIVQNVTDDVKSRASAVQSEVAERGREVWLASLGAVATAADEAQRVVNSVLNRAQKGVGDTVGVYRSLVERGEEREAEGKRQISEAVDAISERQEALSAKLGDLSERARSPRELVGTRAEEVETTVRNSMDTVLSRLDAPSRTEIRDLTAKIDTLATKVNALAKALDEEAEAAAAEAAAPTVLRVVTADEGWAVKTQGQDEPLQTYGTKAEALDAARTLAKVQAPSRLTVYRMDGTVQDSTSYDAS